MKSLIASLRSLTLPFGATSGPRIVLNGVLGRIEIYSDAGNLLMTLDDDGLIVYDADGDERQRLGDVTDFSSIVLRDEDGINPAVLTYQPIISATYRALSLQAPVVQPFNDLHRLFLKTPLDDVTNALLQWDTGFLSPTGVTPLVDLTGFTGARAASVVVNEIRRGSSNGGGNAPTLGQSYPRGLVAFGSNNTDVTLSTTAGVASTIVGVDTPASGAIDVIAGRWYKVTLCGGHSFVSGGSGFTVGDFWEFSLERDVNASGVWGPLTGVPANVRVRANVAIAARFPIPVVVGMYQPAAAGSIRFRARAVKGGGAATVTTGVGTDSGNSPIEILVEDMGTIPL